MSGARALVLGATGGLGLCFVDELASRVSVTRLSRQDGLDFAVPDRAETAILQAAEHGPYELIIDATGVLAPDGRAPEKRLAAIEAETMALQFAVNATGPALVLKHYDALMPRTGRSVFATLSARVGSIGDNRLGGWIGYRAAKAALNQIVRTAAVEIARSRPESVCVALHPGTVRTGLSTPFLGSRSAAEPADAARDMLAVLDGLTPGDSGGFFAYDGQPISW